MIYLTDTHSLIWFFTEHTALSQKSKAIFEAAEQGENTIIIPLIVLSELFYLCEKKNVQPLFSQIMDKLSEQTSYTAYEFNFPVFLTSTALSKIPEMHDRIITATAKVLHTPLITRDEKITLSGYIKTIW